MDSIRYRRFEREPHPQDVVRSAEAIFGHDTESVSHFSEIYRGVMDPVGDVTAEINNYKVIRHRRHDLALHATRKLLRYPWIGLGPEPTVAAFINSLDLTTEQKDIINTNPHRIILDKRPDILVKVGKKIHLADCAVSSSTVLAAERKDFKYESVFLLLKAIGCEVVRYPLAFDENGSNVADVFDTVMNTVGVDRPENYAEYCNSLASGIYAFSHLMEKVKSRMPRGTIIDQDRDEKYVADMPVVQKRFEMSDMPNIMNGAVFCGDSEEEVYDRIRGEGRYDYTALRNKIVDGENDSYNFDQQMVSILRDHVTKNRHEIPSFEAQVAQLDVKFKEMYKRKVIKEHPCDDTKVQPYIPLPPFDMTKEIGYDSKYKSCMRVMASILIGMPASDSLRPFLAETIEHTESHDSTLFDGKYKYLGEAMVAKQKQSIEDQKAKILGKGSLTAGVGAVKYKFGPTSKLANDWAQLCEDGNIHVISRAAKDGSTLDRSEKGICHSLDLDPAIVATVPELAKWLSHQLGEMSPALADLLTVEEYQKETLFSKVMKAVCVENFEPELATFRRTRLCKYSMLYKEVFEELIFLCSRPTKDKEICYSTIGFENVLLVVLPGQDFTSPNSSRTMRIFYKQDSWCKGFPNQISHGRLKGYNAPQMDGWKSTTWFTVKPFQAAHWRESLASNAAIAVCSRLDQFPINMDQSSLQYVYGYSPIMYFCNKHHTAEISQMAKYIFIAMTGVKAKIEEQFLDKLMSPMRNGYDVWLTKRAIENAMGLLNGRYNFTKSKKDDDSSIVPDGIEDAATTYIPFFSGVGWATSLTEIINDIYLANFTSREHVDGSNASKQAFEAMMKKQQAFMQQLVTHRELCLGRPAYNKETPQYVQDAQHAKRLLASPHKHMVYSARVIAEAAMDMLEAGPRTGTWSLNLRKAMDGLDMSEISNLHSSVLTKKQDMSAHDYVQQIISKYGALRAVEMAHDIGGEVQRAFTFHTVRDRLEKASKELREYAKYGGDIKKAARSMADAYYDGRKIYEHYDAFGDYEPIESIIEKAKGSIKKSLATEAYQAVLAIIKTEILVNDKDTLPRHLIDWAVRNEDNHSYTTHNDAARKKFAVKARQKCAEYVYKYLRKRDPSSAIPTLIEGAWEWCYSDSTAYIHVVPKAQIGAPRDISIQTGEQKPAQALAERIFKVLCQGTEEEKITKRAKLVQTVHAANKPVKKDFVRVFKNSDKSKWGPGMVCTLFMSIVNSFRPVIGDGLSDMLNVLMVKMMYKEIELPASVTSLFLNSKLNPENLSDVLKFVYQEFLKNKDKATDKDGYWNTVILVVSMLQGFFNYGSSFMHALMCQYLNKMMTRVYPEMIGRISMENMVTSDDRTSCVDFNPNREAGMTPAEKYAELMSMINKYDALDEAVQRLFCILENWAKTAWNQSVIEFNSSYGIGHQSVSPVRKFLATLTSMRPCTGILDDTQQLFSTISSIDGNGISLTSSYFLQKLSGYIIRDVYRTGKKGSNEIIYNGVSFPLNSLPIQFGGWPDLDPLALRVCGINYHDYLLYLDEKEIVPGVSPKKIMNFLMAEAVVDDVTEESGTSITSSRLNLGMITFAMSTTSNIEAIFNNLEITRDELNKHKEDYPLCQFLRPLSCMAGAYAEAFRLTSLGGIKEMTTQTNASQYIRLARSAAGAVCSFLGPYAAERQDKDLTRRLLQEARETGDLDKISKAISEGRTLKRFKDVVIEQLGLVAKWEDKDHPYARILVTRSNPLLDEVHKWMTNNPMARSYTTLSYAPALKLKEITTSVRHGGTKNSAVVVIGHQWGLLQAHSDHYDTEIRHPDELPADFAIAQAYFPWVKDTLTETVLLLDLPDTVDSRRRVISDTIRLMMTSGTSSRFIYVIGSGSTLLTRMEDMMSLQTRYGRKYKTAETNTKVAQNLLAVGGFTKRGYKPSLAVQLYFKIGSVISHIEKSDIHSDNEDLLLHEVNNFLQTGSIQFGPGDSRPVDILADATLGEVSEMNKYYPNAAAYVAYWCGVTNTNWDTWKSVISLGSSIVCEYRKVQLRNKDKTYNSESDCELLVSVGDRSMEATLTMKPTKTITYVVNFTNPGLYLILAKYCLMKMGQLKVFPGESYVSKPYPENLLKKLGYGSTMPGLSFYLSGIDKTPRIGVPEEGDYFVCDYYMANLERANPEFKEGQEQFELHKKRQLLKNKINKSVVSIVVYAGEWTDHDPLEIRTSTKPMPLEVVKLRSAYPYFDVDMYHIPYKINDTLPALEQMNTWVRENSTLANWSSIVYFMISTNFIERMSLANVKLTNADRTLILALLITPSKLLFDTSLLVQNRDVFIRTFIEELETYEATLQAEFPTVSRLRDLPNVRIYEEGNDLKDLDEPEEIDPEALRKALDANELFDLAVAKAEADAANIEDDSGSDSGTGDDDRYEDGGVTNVEDWENKPVEDRIMLDESMFDVFEEKKSDRLRFKVKTSSPCPEIAEAVLKGAAHLLLGERSQISNLSFSLSITECYCIAHVLIFGPTIHNGKFNSMPWEANFYDGTGFLERRGHTHDELVKSILTDVMLALLFDKKWSIKKMTSEEMTLFLRVKTGKRLVFREHMEWDKVVRTLANTSGAEYIIGMVKQFEGFNELDMDDIVESIINPSQDFEDDDFNGGDNISDSEE